MAKKDRLLKAIFKNKIDTTPIWIMRQAGRYLPEYRKLRSQVGSFMNLCKTPELACEITLQPIRRFDLDAAIIFSDILTIPDAMGLGLYFVEGQGPKFSQVIQSKSDIENLPAINAEVDLDYVAQAIKLTVAELDIPLIGFVGSPWTMATYMLEGGSSKHFYKVKSFAFKQSEAMHLLLQKLASAAADLLITQISAGASVVQIFDSWGGILCEEDYKIYSLQYIQQIIDRVKSVYSEVPVIIFTKGGGNWLEAMAKTGADVIGLDWTVNICKARQRVGSQVSLQGNLDPAKLTADQKQLRIEIEKILSDYGKGSGHVFNLGHGIQPHIDPDNVKLMVDTVHQIGEKYQH